MALNKDLPESPYAIFDPDLRWFPADEALPESSSEKLMPPLVPQLRKKVKEWRDSGYVAATDTSKSLLNWWFNTTHCSPKPMAQWRSFSTISPSARHWKRSSIRTTWWECRTNST